MFASTKIQAGYAGFLCFAMKKSGCIYDEKLWFLRGSTFLRPALSSKRQSQDKKVRNAHICTAERFATPGVACKTYGQQRLSSASVASGEQYGKRMTRDKFAS
jgi:hypothetical protein